MRLLGPAQARKQLPELEVSRNVPGIGFEQPLEVAYRGWIVSEICALESESVSRERVAWLLGDKLLENFAA